jgi:hypothetical protein
MRRILTYLKIFKKIAFQTGNQHVKTLLCFSLSYTVVRQYGNGCGAVALIFRAPRSRNVLVEPEPEPSRVALSHYFVFACLISVFMIFFIPCRIYGMYMISFRPTETV